MNFFSHLISKFVKYLDHYKLNKTSISTKLTTNSPHSITTLVFAHRGSKCNRPENTLISFREAIRIHSDGIELDVHLTADKQLVVIHDETIDRTTNNTGLVRDLTLTQIKCLDAGSWFGPEFSGEPIPSLYEVLSLLTELNFKGILNIEIKTDNYPYPNIEKKLSEMMTSRTWPFHYLYSSFNLDSLKMIHEFESNTELAYLTRNKSKEIAKGEKARFISSLHPKKSYLFSHPKRAILSSKPIRVWTINKESEMQIAFQSNIAGIITDYPEKALQYRDTVKK